MKKQLINYWIKYKIQEGNIEHGLHLETDSYLFKPDIAQQLKEEFGLEDVTDIYQELTARNHGFRVVRVGISYTGELGRFPNKAMAIKNYATGEIHVISPDGTPAGIVPKSEASIVFSSCDLVTVIEHPLLFFNSLDEAIASRRTA